MENKEIFLKLLSGLKDQWKEELANQNKLTEVYGEESNIPMHNLDALQVPVVEVMASLVYMEDEKAVEEIHRYMYELNFGTVDASDIRDGEDLWNVLNVGKKVEEVVDMFKNKLPNVEHDLPGLSEGESLILQLILEYRAWRRECIESEIIPDFANLLPLLDSKYAIGLKCRNDIMPHSGNTSTSIIRPSFFVGLEDLFDVDFANIIEKRSDIAIKLQPIIDNIKDCVVKLDDLHENLGPPQAINSILSVIRHYTDLIKDVVGITDADQEKQKLSKNTSEDKIKKHDQEYLDNLNMAYKLLQIFREWQINWDSNPPKQTKNIDSLATTIASKYKITLNK